MKNLVAIGNSLGIIIEKPILDLLKIGRETALDVTTDGTRLIIQPLTEEKRAALIKESSAWVIEKHRETLRKLAQ